MTIVADWAARLAAGTPIAESVTLVVAHPDDETLWAGATLRRLSNLTLILLTDGAPEDMSDAHRLGFATRGAYAAARARELEAALTALDATPTVIRYDLPDQGLIHRLPELVRRLSADLAGAALTITHPYEGGHPDHDAAALAVSRAARSPVVEFACYAQFDGTREFARFCPHDGAPEHTRALTPADTARVDAALAAHGSQASVFGNWRPTHERWRAAPTYDFALPPPGEGALYDGFGWAMTSRRWRELAGGMLVSEAP